MERNRADLLVGTKPTERTSSWGAECGARSPRPAGTLGKAFSVRDIDPLEGRLTAVAEGDIEVDDEGVMIMHRVRVKYRLVAPPDKREAAERAHKHHVAACGVAKSLGPALDISTELEIVDA